MNRQIRSATGAEYNLNGKTLADGIFGVFNALGTVAFAYGGHNVILEIQVSVVLSVTPRCSDLCCSVTSA